MDLPITIVGLVNNRTFIHADLISSSDRRQLVDMDIRITINIDDLVLTIEGANAGLTIVREERVEAGTWSNAYETFSSTGREYIP